MLVLATAGHVDHGKTSLLQALTGMQADRWEEEQRRGLTIDLGYAWTEIDGRTVSFVDVPGHERFLRNALAGFGPVPGVLFVVAANEGWREQSGEHLAALDALGVTRGLVAVTKADLADPGPAAAAAEHALASTSLAGLPCVAVSARTGEGLDELRRELVVLADTAGTADAGAPVRLWVDRRFTVRGVGTVVTGTLSSGRVEEGHQLHLGDRPVTVKSLQSLDSARRQVDAPARVAVALRGVDLDDVRRGDRLTTEPRTGARSVDVRLRTPLERAPGTATVHAGAAAVPARVRLLAPDLARVELDAPLPVLAGERLLIRDPGDREVIVGAEVLALDPPRFAARGAARRRAEELAGRVEAAALVARAGFLPRTELPAGPLGAGLRAVAGWVVTEAYWTALGDTLAAVVEAAPGGVGRAALLQQLGLPAPAVLAELVLAQGEALRTRPDGRIALAADRPAHLTEALGLLRDRWAADPCAAPPAEELKGWRVTEADLGRLAGEGELLALPGGIAVSTACERHAVTVLATLPEPFTASEARSALGSSRRVVVPLLERLDRLGLTVRAPDSTRRLGRAAREATRT